MLYFIKKHKEKTVVFGLAALFLYLVFLTRFFNLGWGLPYPMHPDERNMAVAIMDLECKALDRFFEGSIGGNAPGATSQLNSVDPLAPDPTAWTECLNPHFFAYGQFPLYVSYIIVHLYHWLSGIPLETISFEQATMALRLIAASCSVITVFILFKLLQLYTSPTTPHKKVKDSPPVQILLLLSLLFVFTPGLIQFSKYGTTEAILFTVYIALIYIRVLALHGRISKLTSVLWSAVVAGIGIATKITALPFLIVPGLTLLQLYSFKRGITKADIIHNLIHLLKMAGWGVVFLIITGILSIILSPYNIIDSEGFLGSMRYESSVGLGTYVAFYTRQFVDTVPLFFHFGYILPFVLGLPLFFLFVTGFFFLSWKRSDINLLRIALVVFAITQVFLFAKWTRFLAPVFPIMSLFAVLMVYRLYEVMRKRLQPLYTYILISLLVLVCSLPGIAFFNVYVKPDVRYTASSWIYAHIPEQSYILSETANVIDLPITNPNQFMQPKTYQYISFDSYNLDTDPMLQLQFKEHIAKADYIFVPTRRVFANHTCILPQEFDFTYEEPALVTIDQRLPYISDFGYYKETCENRLQSYPALNAYYEDLFSGKSGFEPVAEFSSMPDIRLFGIRVLAFPDEFAEETWTVFDHPVVRIYKRVE